MLKLTKKLTAALETKTLQWIILLIASIMVLFGNAQQWLSGDALLYANEARLMAETGEYATLRFGQEINHHGPLLFWLTAISIKLLGFTPFTATLVSRLFGIGCVILTGFLGSHLYGKNTGWFAALALATCYTFVRNTATLRMDSALTFGILLAMLGYFRGRKVWGPLLFYGGIAISVLAKSLPGLLPLFLAPWHALLDGNLDLPWKRRGRRWLYWSPLLLLPVLWWGYLVTQYGTVVFASYIADLMSVDAGQSSGIHHVYRFFEVYFYDFARKYLPWIIFTMIGLKIVFRSALNSHEEKSARANAGLLLGWIIAVLIVGGLKPSQYQRYLLPALPAIAVVTSIAVVRRLKNRMPIWAPGSVALLTFIAGAGWLTEPLLSRLISGLVVSMAFVHRTESAAGIETVQETDFLS